MRWYALYVRSCMERRVSSALFERQVENLWPSYSVKQKHKVGRKTEERVIQRSLFPGYVFGRLNWREQRHAVNAVPQIARILNIDGEPLVIPDHEIESVRLLMAAPEVGISPHPYVELGDRVRIKHGPWTGLEGFVSILRGKSRVVVSLHAIRSSVISDVEFDADTLESLSRRAA